MATIGISSNTEVPCFQVIQLKGYLVSRKVYFQVDIVEDGRYEFSAIKDDVMLTASNLEELLGLITMWEHRGDQGKDWRANHDEHLEYQKVMDDETIVYDKNGNIVEED
jgi:hypothetical protein